LGQDERSISAKRTAMPANLLFIFADQLRAGDLGCEGNPDAITPNLDAMAASGVRFTNAVSTCPVCTPYRAALLTGKYPLSNGMVINDIRLPVTERSIGHVLREAGYDTAYFGKWHLDGPYRGGFTPPGPRRQGFDTWAAADCCHDYMRSWYYRDDPYPIWIDGYDADHFTDLTIEFVREHVANSHPFAAFLSLGPPHNPYDQLPPDYRLHDPQALTLRPNVPKADEALAREQYAGYYDHITALDRCLGRLREALEQTGQSESTLVIFTSDHGDMLRSHGWYEKQLPYEESVAVPFLACQPGTLPEGHLTDALLNVPDLMPTMLSQLGVECPPEVDGADLSFALRGEAGNEPTSAYLANPVPFMPNRLIPEWRSVRTKTHTYAETLDGSWLLFDNERDPYQQQNLAQEPSAATVRAHLQSELQAWLSRLNDEFLPLEAYVERFNYTLAPTGHPVYYGEVGLHDPDTGEAP
jgi:arylsulfatase A-like enzyme